MSKWWIHDLCDHRIYASDPGKWVLVPYCCRGEVSLYYLFSCPYTDVYSDAKSPRITTVLAAVGKVINIIDLGYIYLWKAVLWKSHTKWTATKERWHQRTNRRKNRTLRAWADICIFRPIELINTAWLLYIVMAQTVGSYKTCKCQASVWVCAHNHARRALLTTDLRTGWSKLH